MNVTCSEAGRRLPAGGGGGGGDGSSNSGSSGEGPTDSWLISDR